MKKVLTVLLPALLTFMVSDAQINTPSLSPGSEVKQTVGLTEITVNYSRPSMRDRTIFAEDGLVPFGEIWRTGANAATTIEFDKDVTFAGRDVEAGKYALYTIPGPSEWTVMLYSDLSLGGNTDGYDEENEVARATVDAHQMDISVQTFTIDIGNLSSDGATLGLIWEQTYVPVQIQVHTDEQVQKQIDDFTSNPMGQVAGNYLNAGWYMYNTGKDKQQGLEMVSKGCEYTTSPFKYFWLNRKAMIQADLGDYKGAIKTAKMAHEAGKNAPENARGFYENTVKAQLDENIKMWSEKS